MKKEEFEIGKTFYTETGPWRCTDIGTRVVVAIELELDAQRDYSGPPYAFLEEVFDEDAMKKCSANPEDFDTGETVLTGDSELLERLEEAMLFVNSARYGENTAILDKESGKIYYHSSIESCEEMESLDEEFNPDIHLEIPHKNELDLGQQLVFKFTEEHMPAEFDRVDGMFRKRGAYAKYKQLLDSKGLLQSWYDFEQRGERAALLEWCRENGIRFE